MFPLRTRSALGALIWAQQQLHPRVLSLRDHAPSIAQNSSAYTCSGQTRPLFSGLKKSLKKLVGVELTPQEKQQDAIERVMDEATKNAPPMIKLFSKMVQPLIKRMAEQASVMSQEVETVQADARRALLADSTITAALGTSLDTSVPFEQSSMNINGVTSLSLRFHVTGPKGSGICKVVVNEKKIEEFTVTVGAGKTMHVKTGVAGRVGSSRVIDID